MESLWQEQYPPTVSDEVKASFCENVIVGAGLTGSSLAYHFSKRQSNSIVLESGNKIASGATGYNGAIMWADGSDPFQQETLKHMKSELPMDKCYYDVKGGYTFSLSSKFVSEDKISPKSEIATSSNTLESIPGIKPGVINTIQAFEETAGTCIGTQLVNEIALLSKPFGKFYTSCLVTSYKTEPDGMITVSYLHNHVERTIQCKNLILACNAWIPKLVPELKEFLYPCTNCIVANSVPVIPENRWKFSGFVVGDTDRQIYGSMNQDGFAIIGGLRSMAPNKSLGRDTNKELEGNDKEIMAELRKMAESILEDPIVLDKYWVGVLTSTIDHLPILGNLSKNVSIVGGFNGHGMPRCFGAAKIMVHQILGEDLQPIDKEIVEQWNVNRFLPKANI